MTRFILSFEGWQAEFDVDLDVAQAPCLECLEFFGDPVTREETPEGTVEAFLKFIGRQMVELSSQPDEGIIKEMASLEGFFPLDGSKGVTLVYCDSFDFSPDDFSVSYSKAK